MYLLDTNHCSAIILGQSNVIRRITEVGESKIATCVIVQGELTYMIENSAQRETNLVSLAEFIEDIRIYGVTEDTASIYGQLKAALMTLEEYVNLFLSFFLNLGKVADCSVDLNKVRSKLFKYGFTTLANQHINKLYTELDVQSLMTTAFQLTMKDFEAGMLNAD